MLVLSTLALSLPFTAVLANSKLQSRSRHRNVARSVQRRTNTSYTLTDIYEGKTFFDGWDFFTSSDPTNGLVNFQSEANATSKGLAYVQDDDTVVIAVDHSTTLASGSKRDSVRISTKKTYNSGLFIADFYAMPHGCSVWPAWWSVGPSWPDAGEIDIIEGVNTQTTNQYTLHTTSGCTLDKTNSSNNLFTANVLNTQCESIPSDNTGCAFLDTDTTTFGKGFNDIAGGVFAHLWDDTGISVWHFKRTEIPEDISSRNPDPTSWGTPAAFWSSASCDIGNHFYDHVLTLTTTLCGDWAGPAFSTSCSGTCADAVADPTNFLYAKWMVNYIAVYN